MSGLVRLFKGLKGYGPCLVATAEVWRVDGDPAPLARDNILRYYITDPPGLLENTDPRTYHCSCELSTLIEDP